MKTSQYLLTCCVSLLLGVLAATDESASVEAKKVSLDGQIDEEKARLVIQADLRGLTGTAHKSIYSATVHDRIRVSATALSQQLTLNVQAIEGDLRELAFPMSGKGEVLEVTGENLEDWSVRWGASGGRFLVLRIKKGEKRVTSFTGQVKAETAFKDLPAEVTPLAIVTEPPTLANGYVRVDPEAGLSVEVKNPSGVVPIELRFLPEPLRATNQVAEVESQAYRFHGSGYLLPLRIASADPETGRVVLRDFHLVGQLSDGQASFTLGAVAKVNNPRGGRLAILSGGAALTGYEQGEGWRLEFAQGRFVAVFDKAGEFRIQVRFNASIELTNGWRRVNFGTAPGTLQPVLFRGLGAETQFQFAGAARPERAGEEFRSYLPPDGRVELGWRTARPEQERTLFYAAEILSQVTVSPGLMRQAAVLDFKVMQGELSRVVLGLTGTGEVTRVQGPAVVAWNVTPGSGANERFLNIRLNEAQKDRFVVQVETQTALGAFPQAMNVPGIRPENATRFGGWVRIVNEGAVRIEVVQAIGLSQISPEQYPQTEASKLLGGTQATQTFAYRYSGGDFQLRLQADNILPEVTVSEVLAYHLGETELAVDAEMELDVRDAPLRELVVRVPTGYSVARLNATGLSDYFITETEAETGLRLVYGTPMSGRQVIDLRMERNKPLGEDVWRLPRIEVLKAKSVRGHVGVTADAGYRMTPGATQGLTEIATAFFPKKLAGIQAAYRLSDPAWSLSLTVERLPQSIQADVLHLFSVGEGIAYGSSIMNYVISGAPTGVLRIELSDEYYNVEFSGKDIRSWQKIEGGYQVQLHTPVSGAYTLLATYERPFKTQGERLTFTGARPADAMSEQGHTVVVSTYQFKVQPVNVSASLTPLEPGEVPAEQRLFFDAPILAAYRYTSRPFNLQLALEPLAQGDTVSQVVDRASLTTRISREGQVVTEAVYYVKNKGVPHLRLSVPEGSQLWSVMVNRNVVVPVADGRTNLIPLPQRNDPDSLNELRVKIASRARSASRLTVSAPVLSAPVLLSEWRLVPDDGRKLIYRGGTLSPAGGVIDPSGFAGLRRMLTGDESWRVAASVALSCLLSVVGAMVFRFSASEGVHRFGLRHVVGGLVGIIAGLVAVAVLFSLVSTVSETKVGVSRELVFVAPVQQADVALSAEIGNADLEPSGFRLAWTVWPGLAGLIVWIWARLTSREWLAKHGVALGWVLVFWGSLRLPDGGAGFFVVACVFVLFQVLWPALRRWWHAPPKPGPVAGAGPGGAAVSVTAAMLMGGFFLAPESVLAQATRSDAPKPAVRADSVIQQIRAEEEFVIGSAKIKWQAEKGQVLPILHAPGVLTSVDFPSDMARLVQLSPETRPAQALLADKAGTVEIDLRYQVRAVSRQGERGFALPVEQGLVNEVTLTVVGQDVDIHAAQAVSCTPKPSGGATNTVATLVLMPEGDVWIGWRPRARDTRREAVVIYADLNQLYVPAAGVVEGRHLVNVRPAQGEVTELVFSIPDGLTVSDVEMQAISAWRFDPAERRLRVSMSPAQSRPFSLLIKSQIAIGPLPIEQKAGLIVLDQAAGQVGLLGVATGAEVQLDDTRVTGLSAINLEDFPSVVLEPLRRQAPGLTLRRAYRYADPSGSIVMKASSVAADVRVESQQTLSLGEDRTVLAATLETQIARAGIFKLSFALPAGMDVESVSGQALSHWTELKTDEGRIITLHLRSRTEGKQSFVLGLVGPGVRSATNWAVPRLMLREADKHSGQLMIVPEQGLRLQVTARDGVTQMDPVRSGVRQKGVLAFRILQRDWHLAIDLERIDAWTQVTTLQHLTISDAQVRVDANMQYEIENTGLKSLFVRLPVGADSVRFRGEQVSDYVQRESGTNSVWRDWEVKLHRRVIGKFLLQLSYRLPVPQSATEMTLLGIEAQEVNLQRGFLTLQTAGRLQVRIDSPPGELQPAEWQSIPRALQQGIAASGANYTYRVVEPAFSLPVKLVRHEAARLLPARVQSLTMNSAVADDGLMLTQVTLQLVPGDKRLLRITLPKEARFWFAFVNQNSVWPWRETNEVLIPLQQHSKITESTMVEFFYSSRTGRGGPRSLDLQVVGPRFDLPLENITWHVFLNEKWRLTHWRGSLQLQSESPVPMPVTLDLASYIENETVLQQQKTREAEEFLSNANKLLERGDPEQARRHFQAAFGLSQHDSAFNEDARVQLHNLKMQQALVGLNVGQAKVAGEAGALAAIPRALREGQTIYTQQEAKQLIERNAADDNAVQMRLAERIIQQQEAALPNPAAIRASIPQQGRMLVFTRPLEVDPRAELSVRLSAAAAHPAPLLWRLASLATILAVVMGLCRVGRGLLGDSGGSADSSAGRRSPSV